MDKFKKMNKDYDFKISEPKWQEFWEKEKIFAFNPKSKKIFSIDTPPPTMSGKMHLGHAFSYTHTDITARYKRMKEFSVLYPFGVDNNGLPTEKLVEKINNVTLFQLGREKFIELCQKTIKDILPDFVAGWKRIGLSCDFDNAYSTISPEVQKLSQEYFLDLYNKGRIYKKEMPMLWCPECQTAIAQAELEDKEIETFFNDIEFSLTSGEKILISTTRPELLPSCVAIFVHPSDESKRYLIGKTAIVPIFNQEVPILFDDKVDINKGTGIVMSCTFGDKTDMEWYFKHNLPLKISITKDRKLNELAKEFSGLSIKEARAKITERLRELNLLKSQKKILHTVNVHERCQTEIEILPTNQWFVKYLDLRNQFLKQSSKMIWRPKFMKSRLDNWINGLSWDWCFSRQRYFGIPIPAWYCKNCKKIIVADKDQLPIDPLSAKPKTKCSCGSDEFIPETDILDTWMTSSLTPQIVLSRFDRKTAKKAFPMSMRPQAHDIINFWLFYTMVRSYLHFKSIPFKEIIVSGFLLDPKGEKMSKSKGNVIEPETVINQYGADALRCWASQASLGDDLKFNEEEIKNGKRLVTKLWNAFKFCTLHLGNYSMESADTKLLQDEDKWILNKFSLMTKEYYKEMDEYEYSKAKDSLDKFFWSDFCDNYLEIIKARVYENKDKGVQYALYYLLLNLLKLYSPIIPFITEEIYQEFFKNKEQIESIHLLILPENKELFSFPKEGKDFENAIQAIEQIRKYKSEQKISVKAEIESITIETKERDRLQKYLPLIEKIMAVKKIQA